MHVHVHVHVIVHVIARDTQPAREAVELWPPWTDRDTVGTGQIAGQFPRD